jgi:hypothetical protein
VLVAGSQDAEVGAVNDAALSAVASGGLSGTEGGTTGSSVYLGTFNDVDGNCAASDYKAALAGGGTGTIQVASAGNGHAGACNFDVFGTFNLTDEGTTHPTVTVTETDNPGGPVATLSPTITIADAALSAQSVPSANCTYFNSCTFTAAKVTDSNTSCNGEGEAIPSPHYSATVNYGDATSGPGTITQIGTSCVFTVSATHTYMSAGPFIVTVTFTDEGGQSVTTSTGAGTASTVTVSAPAATPNSVSGNLPFAAATYYQGGYILSFVARGLSGTPNYSGNLNYQDTPGSFSITGCNTITGSNAPCWLQVESMVCVGNQVQVYGYDYVKPSGPRYYFRIDVSPGSTGSGRWKIQTTKPDGSMYTKTLAAAASTQCP